MKTITVVGIGYVGLPLACLCAEKGLNVYGFDKEPRKIQLVNNGISPINDARLIKKLEILKGKIRATNEPSECISKSDVVIVCVPTPVDENNTPDLTALTDAVSSISGFMRKGALLVIESTIYPGTVEEVVVPILKKQKFDPYKNEMLVAHCPERIDPGNVKWGVGNLPRVVGGLTELSLREAADFYRGIIDADVVELSSVKAAEAVKIIENTFRDVNIAFVNEMAKSFDKAGIDILEVIKGASTKPFAFMPHYPGAGVGGHCIAQDPYYMIERGRQLGFNHEFLILARKINRSMPHYTVSLLESGLKKLGKALSGAKVGVLGLAYKANVDDGRESPAKEIINILKGKKAEVFVFDPYLKEESNCSNLKDLLQESDYIILATCHSDFKDIEDELKENEIKIVIDGRNFLDKEKIKSMGIMYHGIGRA